MPEDAYVEALLRDLDFELRDAPETRPLVSIFMGGGTPSLFSDRAIGRVLERVQKRANFAPDIEITLEANPGTAEAAHFAGRSEEHTSELQSLMSISYAVLCLKKKQREKSTTPQYR